MAQVGSLEWVVQAKQAGEAKAQVEEVGESFSDTAEQAEQAEQSTAGFSDVLGAAGSVMSAFGVNTRFVRQSLAFFNTVLTFSVIRLKALSAWLARASASLAGFSLASKLSGIASALAGFASSIAAALSGTLALPILAGLIIGGFSVAALKKLGVLDWFYNLGQETGAVLDDIDLSVQGLKDTLGTGWGKLKTDISTAFTNAKDDAIGSLKKIDKFSVGDKTVKIDTTVNKAVKGLRTGGQKIRSIMQRTSDGGIALGNKFERGVNNAIGRAADFTKRKWQGFVGTFNRGFSKLTQITGRGWGRLKQIMRRGAKRLSNIMRRGWGRLTQILSRGWKRLTKIMTRGAKRLPKVMRRGFGRLRKVMTRGAKRLVTILTGGWTRLKKKTANALQGLVQSVGSTFGSLGSTAKSAGKSLVTGFIDGIKSKLSAVGDAVDKMAQKARDRLPFSPAKVGPLSDLDKSGPGFVDEVATGIESNTGQLASASESAAGAMDPSQSGGGGGGGGAAASGGGEPTVVIESIDIGDQSLDMSDLRRRDLETLATLIAEQQGDELKRLLGT